MSYEIDELVEEVRRSLNNIQTRDNLRLDFIIKLKVAQQQQEMYESLINFIDQMSNIPVNLKWRKEIRECFVKRELETSTILAECIASRNKIKIDKNIRTKVSTTLSLMFNEGAIGRTQMNGERDFYYGDINRFEKDNDGKYTILKT